jgi:DsbC/DsbD-like thiol-disulfide interchange protein
MKLSCPLFLALVLPCVALAQKKPGEAASIASVEIQSEPKPGAKVTAVIKVKMEEGYHTHSNKPSQPEFIPTKLTLTPPAGVKVGEIVYPKGKTRTIKGLDKPASLYEGEFQISVPLTLSKDISLPSTIPAVLGYQACQGATCYPPKKLPFEISVGKK